MDSTASIHRASKRSQRRAEDAVRTRHSQVPTIITICLVAAALACAEAPQPEPEPDPVVNQQLNVKFPKVPHDFEVATNSGNQLELSVRSGIEKDGVAKTGKMWVTVDERSDFGIDLVGIMQGQKDEYLALEGGAFSGSQQLGTPSGVGYYSRGQFDENGARQEETRVHLVHPTENRLVTFFYRYPAGEDSGERVQELLVWVGELEPAESLETEGSSDAEDGTDAADSAD